MVTELRSYCNYVYHSMCLIFMVKARISMKLFNFKNFPNNGSYLSN